MGALLGAFLGISRPTPYLPVSRQSSKRQPSPEPFPESLRRARSPQRRSAHSTVLGSRETLMATNQFMNVDQSAYGKRSNYLSGEPLPRYPMSSVI